jgi:hypothetical protein
MDKTDSLFSAKKGNNSQSTEDILNMLRQQMKALEEEQRQFFEEQKSTKDL